MIKFISLVAIAFFSLATASIVGQDPASVKLKGELVIVNVAVEDERGRPVTGLRKEDFMLYEEKTPQEIRHFGAGEEPLSVALLIDTSDSMRFGFSLALNAASAIVNLLNPADKVALFTTHNQTRLIHDFGAERQRITETILNLRWERGGGIHTNDAVMAATQHLKTVAKGNRRVTIIVTDDDPYPPNTHSATEALHEALESDNTIYCVQVKTKLQSVLRRLNWVRVFIRVPPVRTYAEETGGSVVTIGDEKELSEKLTGFVDQLRSGYVIGYYPSDRAKQGLRRIKVDLTKTARKRTGSVRLRYRQGYLAAQAGQTQAGLADKGGEEFQALSFLRVAVKLGAAQHLIKFIYGGNRCQDAAAGQSAVNGLTRN